MSAAGQRAAANLHASVFRNARAAVLSRCGAGEEPDKEGTVRYADEAVSFMVDYATRKRSRSIVIGIACRRFQRPSNAAG
jgi:hypothetical protein